jgi:hypothetical protein
MLWELLSIIVAGQAVMSGLVEGKTGGRPGVLAGLIAGLLVATLSWWGTRVSGFWVYRRLEQRSQTSVHPSSLLANIVMILLLLVWTGVSFMGGRHVTRGAISLIGWDHGRIRGAENR